MDQASVIAEDPVVSIKNSFDNVNITFNIRPPTNDASNFVRSRVKAILYKPKLRSKTIGLDEEFKSIFP